MFCNADKQVDLGSFGASAKDYSTEGIARLSSMLTVPRTVHITPMTRAIGILVVDSSPLMRDAILRLLATDDRFAATAAVDGDLSIIEARSQMADVVIMEIPRDRAEIVGAVTPVAAVSAVLVYTSFDAPSQVRAAMHAGARGFIAKSDPTDGLLQAITDVRGGCIVISPHLRAHVHGDVGGDRLSPALTAPELEVLRMVSRGATDAEIALAMYVSTRTIQNMLTRMRRATGARGRAELTRWAIEQGIA
ncbi:MAG: DNA-binding response regulator [Thermoleophilia bacterium]|nr:DNA-binding response regulator [Thermoleophilia bacterium]